MDALTFTLIQSNLYWENKTANLEMFTQKINDITTATNVIILPEMFTTGFTMQAAALAETMEGETVHWMRKMAATKQCAICGSVIIESKNKYYNRFIWMQANGELQYYDKRHLFAFAGEDENFTGGNTNLIVTQNDLKINCNICYDLRFPVWVRQTENAYDVLIYVANWPQRRSTVWQTLLQARAIENQCYVFGVNRVGVDGKDIYYSGNSMVIDPMGEIIYNKADAEDVFTFTIELQKIKEVREKLPFLKDADKFEII